MITTKPRINNNSALATHVSTAIAYLPEENPYQTLMVDVTHRCNMGCFNCYIPNRDVPDMDMEWLAEILRRLPRRTRIRLAGAEATMRKDLPDLIKLVRRSGHLPILLTNGLKFGNAAYAHRLKRVGLRTVYLSYNGGFDDAAYEAIDGLRCAGRKRKALKNLVRENMYISVGMILVRGINEHTVRPVFDYLRNQRQVYEFHLRSIGPHGRYMKTSPFMLDELIRFTAESLGLRVDEIRAQRVHDTYVDFKLGKLKLQLTQWPDLGSNTRGRLAPDGTIQPFFEHMMANEGGY